MEDMRNPGAQNPETSNPQVNDAELRTRLETRRHRRRRAVRWNYKRIAVAFLALFTISAAAIYGGISLAHWLSKPPEKEKVAVKPKKETPPAINKEVSSTEKKDPGYIEHTVKPGDTLYAIALKYNTTVDKIRELNNIPEGNNNLQVGMVLKIPTKESEHSGEDAGDSLEAQSQGTQTTERPSTATIKPSSKEIVRGPTTSRKVALTFDAGSESEATPQILKALKDANVKATFFLTGKWVDENPALVKQIANEGHLIGNHTDSHPDLVKKKDADIVKELAKAEEKIMATAGISSKPLFRAPYGSRDARVLRIAAESGYRSIYWTVDSLDWKPSMTPDQVKNRILAALSNGSIILEHCGSKQSAKILPQLIKDIKSRGYEIVTVPELFAE